MGKLDGKTAVIHGGSGQVGEGIVKVFLQEGANVIVPTRKPDQLTVKHDRLFPYAVDLQTVEAGEKLKSEILAEFGEIDAVIASLSGPMRTDTPLLNLSLEEFESALRLSLTTHFLAAKTWLPLLATKPGSSYTAIGGLLAENPFPNHGSLNVPTAGLLMMMKLLFKEWNRSGIRINEVVVNSVVASRDKPAGNHLEWVTAEEVGRFTAWLVSDEAAFVTNCILPIHEHFPARVKQASRPVDRPGGLSH